MTALFKKNRMIIVSIIVAITILATAYIANGSDYENAWFYILAVWLVISPAWENYSKKKRRSNRYTSAI